MKKKIFLSIILIGLTACVSFAESGQDIPTLVQSYVESLEMVKPVLLDIYELIDTYDIWSMKNDPNYALRPADIPALQDRLGRFNEISVSAASLIDPFLSSEDESVRMAAERIKGNYTNVALENEKSIAELNAFLENTAAGDEELRNLEYQVGNRIGSFNSSLYQASEWLAAAVQKAYPSGDSSKFFPESERADILTRLEVLGDGKRLTMLEGTHFQNALWPLYEALGGVESVEPQQIKNVAVIGGK